MVLFRTRCKVSRMLLLVDTFSAGFMALVILGRLHGASGGSRVRKLCGATLFDLCTLVGQPTITILYFVQISAAE